MPTILRFRSNYKICIYAGDHPRPHFHVEGPDCDATVLIDTLQLDRGDAPTAILEEAIELAQRNQNLLVAKWNEYNETDDE
jgi:hypothetical protein